MIAAAVTIIFLPSRLINIDDCVTLKEKAKEERNIVIR
jgi:hypothetical protein